MARLSVLAWVARWVRDWGLPRVLVWAAPWASVWVALWDLLLAAQSDSAWESLKVAESAATSAQWLEELTVLLLDAPTETVTETETASELWAAMLGWPKVWVSIQLLVHE